MARDDFNKLTTGVVALRAGYRRSSPSCRAAVLFFAVTACATTPPLREGRPPIALPSRSDEESATKASQPQETVFEGTRVSGSCFGALPVEQISITSFPPTEVVPEGRCTHETPNDATSTWTCVDDNGTRTQIELIRKGEPTDGYQTSRLLWTITNDERQDSSCIYEGQLNVSLMSPLLREASQVDSGLSDGRYPFEPKVVVLKGELRREERFGPPNYGETPEQDAKMAVWILHLPEPITAGTPATLSEVNTKPVPDVSEVQIQFVHGTPDPKKGTASVSGKLGVQTTGSDYLPVVLRNARFVPFGQYEQDVEKAISKHGRFEVTFENRQWDPDCEFWFIDRAGKRHRLFGTHTCDGQYPGTHQVSRVAKLGELNLPVTLSDGTEVHAFSIAAARGGNAIEMDELWVAFVRPNAAVAHEVVIHGTVVNAKAEVQEGRSVVVSDEPTTTAKGIKTTVTFDTAKSADLAKVPSKVTKSEVVGGEAKFQGEFHYTNWHPLVSLNGSSHVIQNMGTCKAPDASDVQVSVRLRIDAYDDGRTEVNCLSMTPVKK